MVPNLLSATRSTERKILSLLESQGPVKVKDFPRKELAKEAQERNYYNPKLIVPKPQVQFRKADQSFYPLFSPYPMF